jgi:hypothetical protein
MDEIGAHMDEREARTDEMEGTHGWREDEGGAYGGARTPRWRHARLEAGHVCLGRGGAHAREGARVAGG